MQTTTMYHDAQQNNIQLPASTTSLIDAGEILKSA